MDVTYNVIWNPRAFLDEVDPLLRGARAGPASARRRGERRRMRDSRRMSAWSSSDVAPGRGLRARNYRQFEACPRGAAAHDFIDDG